MPTFSKDDVLNEAAGDIGVTEPGEALATEDYDKLSRKYDGLIGLLGGLEVYISDPDEIDGTIFVTLTRMLGNVAASGVVGAPLNDPAWDRDLKLLRQILSTKPTYETLKACYF